MMKILQRLPLAFVFLSLYLPLGLGMATLLSSRLRTWVRSLEGPPLAGMRNKVLTPQLTWENFISGVFQKQVELWLNEQIPLRAPAIRAINQLYYSVFAKSYMEEGSIVIGKGGQLYGKLYLMKYCNSAGLKLIQNQDDKKLVKVFDQPANYKDFQLWIAELKEVADFFQKRGQKFIYLLTPSKAAYYPEDIPAGFDCSSATPRLEYQMAIAALRQSGINYVDASKIVLDSKGKYPVELFPRTGIHWTSLAAALASRELLLSISHNLGRDLPAIEFSYTIDNNPTGSDVDLLELLNLWHPHRNFPVAKLKFKKLTKQPIRLAIVGGSFVHQLTYVLDNSELFCQIDHYYYLHIEHIRYPSQGGCGIQQEAPGSYQGLLSANVVIVEENEANLRSRHLQVLRNILREKASGMPATDISNNSNINLEVETRKMRR